MLIAWVVYPLVLVVLCAGCGLAVAAVSGERLDPPLVLPVGLAALIVVASAATASDATARAATPLVVVLAVAGFALTDDRRAWLPGRWPASAAAGVFAVFAAPVVASGAATFTGYIQLDDIATWLALTDQVMAHGRDLTSLAASTHEATVAAYLPGGYPVGAFLPLGLGHDLTRQDLAWLFDPTMAALAGLLALTLTSVVSGVVARPWARAVVAFVAAQPALLFSYAEWGALKEVTAALLVALVAALSSSPAGPVRRVAPLAVAAAALLAALSLGGLVWVVPVVGAGALLSQGRIRQLATSSAALAVAVAVLAIPSLLLARAFVVPQAKAGSVLSAPTELGNLRAPLGLNHVLGIWPAGDFRLNPEDRALTTLLLATLVLAGLGGLVVAVRRRSGPLAGYVAGGLVACAALISRGSPWVDAKAMATASPIVLTAALAALAAASTSQALRRAPRRAALVGTAVLGAGVLWSNTLTYGHSYPAPKQQLSELEAYGKLLAGQGPTLMTEYEPYGARHFLRAADAESASELRRRVIPLRDGTQLPKSASADITAFDPAALREYRSLVVRTSPLASRPPSAYERLRAGRSYDAWQRPARPPAPFAADLPLGGEAAPGAVPECTAVQRLAQRVGASGRLVAVERTPPVVQGLADSSPWVASGNPLTAVPTGSGELVVDVGVPTAGSYALWLGGSTRGRTTLTVDGRRVGAIAGRLNNQGGMMRFGAVGLAGGLHHVVLGYDDGGLRPGTRGQSFTPLPLGPLVLARHEPALVPFSVPATQADTICDRYLDWIEAYR